MLLSQQVLNLRLLNGHPQYSLASSEYAIGDGGRLPLVDAIKRNQASIGTISADLRPKCRRVLWSLLLFQHVTKTSSMIEVSSKSTRTRIRCCLRFRLPRLRRCPELSWVEPRVDREHDRQHRLLAFGLAQLDANAAVRSSLALAGFLGGAAGALVVERDPAGVWPRGVTLALTSKRSVCRVCRGLDAGWGGAVRISVGGPHRTVSSCDGYPERSVRRLEVSGIATTYITGTLTQLVAPRFMRPTLQNRPSNSRHGMLLGAVWVVYFSGAAVAAIDLRLSSLVAQLLPIAVILCVVVIAAIVFRLR